MNKIERKISEVSDLNTRQFLLLRYHTQNKSTVQIASELKCSYTTVSKCLRKCGIRIRTNSESHMGELNAQFGISPKGKYEIDEKFYNNLNADSCWVIGFLAADGCIESKYHYSFVQKDKKVLTKIAKLLRYSGPIKPNNGIHRLRISNVRHVATLKELGLTPRKSLTLKMPQIPQSYVWDFIRGYFDGDGSIYCTFVTVKGKKYKQWRISFVGSNSFIQELNKIVSHQFNFKKVAVSQYNNVSTVKYSGKAALEILQTMYHRSVPTNRLDRKYQIYQTFSKEMVQ